MLDKPPDKWLDEPKNTTTPAEENDNAMQTPASTAAQ
jgi:hypothetical protein